MKPSHSRLLEDPLKPKFFGVGGAALGFGVALLNRYILGRADQKATAVPEPLGPAFELFALLYAAKTWHEGL